MSVRQVISFFLIHHIDRERKNRSTITTSANSFLMKTIFGYHLR